MVDAIDSLEARLSKTLWLGGASPSKADAEEYADLAGAIPNAKTHPHTWAWY